MGLWDRVKSQFVDVIEWVDDSNDTLVYRFPIFNQEIQMGGKLTVRESQVAVFFNEGKLADIFAPGMYTLSTQNLPVLTTLKHWTHGFDSPFKAEIYFFNMKQFTDLKWGTANPVTVRDPEIGPVRIRAYGTFAMRVKNPEAIVRQISGTMGLFKVADIAGQLQSAIVNGFSDFTAESRVPFLDAASQLQELSQTCKERLSGIFTEYGLELTAFFVENISVPPEVEKVIDKRAGMGVVSDVQKYAQFQAADAIKDAAQNPGGAAGAGVGIGAGVALGQTMMDAMKPGAAAPTAQKLCGNCKHSIIATAKFCPNCGTPQA